MNPHPWHELAAQTFISDLSLVVYKPPLTDGNRGTAPLITPPFTCRTFFFFLKSPKWLHNHQRVILKAINVSPEPMADVSRWPKSIHCELCNDRQKQIIHHHKFGTIWLTLMAASVCLHWETKCNKTTKRTPINQRAKDFHWFNLFLIHWSATQGAFKGLISKTSLVMIGWRKCFFNLLLLEADDVFVF